MSTEAMFWALKQSELKAGPWRILMLLCDAANSESGCAWKMLSTLCRESGMGRSTVIGHIQQLHSAGFIVPGDKRFVSHIRADGRPNVWRPNLHRGTAADLRGETLPIGPTRRGPETGRRPEAGPRRGPENTSHGVQKLDPEPRTEPTDQLKSEPKAQPARAREASDLGTPTPDAVPPTAALDHIAACRAALRKEDPQ